MLVIQPSVNCFLLMYEGLKELIYFYCIYFYQEMNVAAVFSNFDCISLWFYDSKFVNLLGT